MAAVAQRPFAGLRLNLAQRAADIMREYGPVQAGSAAGDFGTITLDPGPGWVVNGHHNDVLTYASR